MSRSLNPNKPEASGPSDADRLRDHIDRGGAADKTAFLDPAAAPLGTDDEAAGTPPTAEQVERARIAEAERADAADHKPDLAEVQNRSRQSSKLLLALVVLAVLAMLLIIGFS